MSDSIIPLDLYNMPVYPEADKYPLLSHGELGVLAEDISRHGLLEPVKIFQGQIIDGRNRLVACEIAGVKPRFKEVSPDVIEKYGGVKGYIEAKNLNRRHLTLEQQRERRAERIERVAEKRREGKSQRQIAKEEGISQTQVAEDIKTATEQGLSVEPKESKIVSKDGKKRPAKAKLKPPDAWEIKCLARAEEHDEHARKYREMKRWPEHKRDDAMLVHQAEEVERFAIVAKHEAGYETENAEPFQVAQEAFLKLSASDRKRFAEWIAEQLQHIPSIPGST